MAKRALITGASGGIGRGIARRLAREGFAILGQGRNQAALDATAEAVRALGGSFDGRIAEFADLDAVATLARWAADAGALDAVIHCAGAYAQTPIAETSFEAWDRIIDEIVRATMRLTALTLPAVRAAGGTYLFVCGPSSWMGMKGASGYCVARHAQAGFARALFEDVREDGVGVTLLHPGFVNTSLVSRERLDPAKMIQVDDIAELATQAVLLPRTACVVEMTVRPQRSPYR
jgi:NAD(P)-dependent dehydrogenase (short-subunit alcohol dehydrogenase family)